MISFRKKIAFIFITSTFSSQTNSSLVDGECTEKKTAAISYEILKFNKSQYR